LTCATRALTGAGNGNAMTHFATYLDPRACATSRPLDEIQFVGHSLPHFSRVRQELERVLAGYPALALRQAEYSDYARVHTQDYLDALARMASGQPVAWRPQLSVECHGLEYCLPGYCYGLGGMMQAIDAMRAGRLDRAYCFSLGGHHAYPDRGHGYCLLNPLAAAARYAQERGLRKILIVDWDIHHGDGTQAIFARDPDVYCISIHSAADLYMATMRVLKSGATTMGEAVGHCNIPVLAAYYAEDDAEQIGLSGRLYRAHESLAAFRSALEHLPWSPDLIMIFSGYDSHRDDCGKDITNWMDHDFERLTQVVLDVALRAACPVLSVHGGGYTLPVTVSAAAAHVRVLAD
jgi:acetoin utilization deacetylase AcuC-like enzyme